MTPKDFIKKRPFGSVFRKTEAEIVALNIMKILDRIGNEWRELSFQEYETERRKDGNFTSSEKQYFDKVIKYCTSENEAKKFSPEWSF